MKTGEEEEVKKEECTKTCLTKIKSVTTSTSTSTIIITSNGNAGVMSTRTTTSKTNANLNTVSNKVVGNFNQSSLVLGLLRAKS